MRKDRAFIMLILLAVLAIKIFIVDCYADYYEDLREFYITKLFAIETQISVLQKKTDKDQTNKLNRLIREKFNIEAKLNRCIICYYKTHQLVQQKPQFTKEEIDRIIEKKARKYGINPNFIKALVQCESGYNVYACSKKGAMGLTQLMPETCKNLGIKNPFSPEENLDGGIRYIISLLKEFKDVKKALYAYNAGPERVRKGKAIPFETKKFANCVLAYFAKLTSQE